MNLYMGRHGQTAASRENRFSGSSDPPLTAEGEAMAHAFAHVLIVSHKATLRVITCALLGLDVRLFRERIAQPVGAVTMFAVSDTTAVLNVLGDTAQPIAECAPNSAHALVRNNKRRVSSTESPRSREAVSNGYAGTTTYSAKDVDAGTGCLSSSRPSTCIWIASYIQRSVSSRVDPVATPPGRSGA